MMFSCLNTAPLRGSNAWKGRHDVKLAGLGVVIDLTPTVPYLLLAGIELHSNHLESRVPVRQSTTIRFQEIRKASEENTRLGVYLDHLQTCERLE